MKAIGMHHKQLKTSGGKPKSDELSAVMTYAKKVVAPDNVGGYALCSISGNDKLVQQR